MQTIKVFLESLFNNLPATAEVKKLREDLLLHLEEKYDDLIARGKSENEAVGTVIAEFGTIEEIAQEMGVDLTSYSAGTEQVIVEQGEAEALFSSNRKSSFLIAGGVLIILLGVAALIGLATLLDATAGGVVVLLLCVLVAVGLFYYSDFLTNPFISWRESGKKIVLTPHTTAYIESRKNKAIQKKMFGTFAGIALIFFGIIALLLLATVTGGHVILGTMILMALIGVGVACIIASSAESGSIDILLQQGEHCETSRKTEKVIGAVAAVWWPLATTVFLLWGFFWRGGFERSWIVWPIAGILFGSFAGFYNAIKRE